MLKAVDRKLGLIGRFADCLPDWRQASKVDHSIEELLARDPIEGESLASQPTLSRFENAVGPRQLFRVLLTAAAYVMLQELRHRAAHTTSARAQVWTLRERLFKLDAHVVATVRRIVLHLPAACPYRGDWQRVAAALAG